MTNYPRLDPIMPPAGRGAGTLSAIQRMGVLGAEKTFDLAPDRRGQYQKAWLAGQEGWAREVFSNPEGTGWVVVLGATPPKNLMDKETVAVVVKALDNTIQARHAAPRDLPLDWLVSPE